MNAYIKEKNESIKHYIFNLGIDYMFNILFVKVHEYVCLAALLWINNRCSCVDEEKKMQSDILGFFFFELRRAIAQQG